MIKCSPTPFARPLALAFAVAVAGLTPAAALAQPYGPPPPWAVPYYDTAHNVLTGMITNAAPYRLVLQLGPGGRTVPVDLKRGTTIVPVGTSLTPGMRVMVRGYWSNGTFVANHVRLR
jgi:hypothetical protein